MSAKGAKDKGKEKTKGKEDGAAEGSPKKAKTDPKKEKGKGAPASEDAAQRETTPGIKIPKHYIIGVRTGDRSYSSTDSDVYCRLLGTKGSTPEFQLVRQFMSDSTTKFERGAAAKFSVETEDVGQVKMVHIRQAADDVAQAWYLAYVTVRVEGSPRKQLFPYYKWVFGQEIDILEASASLPQIETIEAIRHTRRDYITAMRDIYRWSSDNVLLLPGFIADGSPETLPLDDQYDNVRKKYYYGRLAREITEELDIVNVQRYAGRLEWESLEDFAMLFFDDVEVPSIVDKWNMDEEFGRQYLSGCNPIWLKRCDAIPDNFAVTDKLVTKVVKGNTLAELARNGALYIADYAILANIPTYKKGGDVRYCAAPLVLFYVNGEKNLVPIAIQLNQKPGDDNPVFTPLDSEVDWTIAKIWVRCADTQIHQIYTHMLHGHIMIESFAVALLRNLHPSHPVHKMMRPHLHNTIAINVMQRREMIDPEGPTNHTLATGGGGHLKLLEASFAQWSFKQWIIPQDLARRGVENESKLPNYYWRDDALLIWNALLTFVRKMVNHYYATDKSVALDVELQAFADEFSKKGAKGHDFPEKIQTIPQLVEIVTAAIFGASAGHAAVSYSHFDCYASIPNQPRALYDPPPTKKGALDANSLLTLLPAGDEAIASIGMAYELSRFSKTQLFLGNYTDKLFSESQPLQYIDELQDDLVGVTRKILQRNSTAAHPYSYLLPTRVPNSTNL